MRMRSIISPDERPLLNQRTVPSEQTEILH